MAELLISQHKRFVSQSRTPLNFCFAKTSFMLESLLYEMANPVMEVIPEFDR